LGTGFFIRHAASQWAPQTNYFLYAYELAFIEQLVRALQVHPHVSETDRLAAVQLIMSHDEEGGSGGEVLSSEQKAAVAKVLLESFRFTVRFVDDLTSGPNPFLYMLLYCTDSILSGVFAGIYPRSLILERTDVFSFEFSTLDVQIISRVSEEGWVIAYTVLFDKRRQACFATLPIVQYTHVSSLLSERCGYNTLVSQMHRYRLLIMAESNYVLEAAKLVRRLQLRGYTRKKLLRTLRRHLCFYPDTFGASNMYALYYQVTRVLALFDTSPDVNFESFSDEKCHLQDKFYSLSEFEDEEELEEVDVPARYQGIDSQLLSVFQALGLDPDCDYEDESELEELVPSETPESPVVSDDFEYDSEDESELLPMNE
jgi:hypothetical protein